MIERILLRQRNRFVTVMDGWPVTVLSPKELPSLLNCFTVSSHSPGWTTDIRLAVTFENDRNSNRSFEPIINCDFPKIQYSIRVPQFIFGWIDYRAGDTQRTSYVLITYLLRSKYVIITSKQCFDVMITYFITYYVCLVPANQRPWLVHKWQYHSHRVWTVL